jgi:hypothetical protein
MKNAVLKYPTGFEIVHENRSWWCNLPAGTPCRVTWLGKSNVTCEFDTPYGVQSTCLSESDIAWPWRVMIRSVEGWRPGADEHGLYWTRKLVWSTWQEGLTFEAACAEQVRLVEGGVVATLVPEDDYERFTQTHTVC